MNDLKYPVGKFSYPLEYSKESLNTWIETIKRFPEKLEKVIQALSQEELLKTYRPEGWTIQQVVHHCADSHINAYIRLKLALTENNPTIKPYMENLWAELPDSSMTPIGISIEILKGIHFRWIIILQSLSLEDWIKTYTHPETKKITALWEMTALYAWHSEHHYAHIEQALKKTSSN